MRDDQRLQLSQQLAVAAELEVKLDSFDDSAQALLLEPRALSGEQAVRAHSFERLAPPESQRLLDRVPCDSGLAARPRPACSPECLLPAVDVALAGPHLEQVAARLADQAATVGARLGQPL